MATNSKSKGQGAKRAGRGFNGHRFIDYDLTANDKEVLRSEYTEADFNYDLVEDLIGQGFKYSCSWSEPSSCYICSLTDKRSDSQFQNTSLSGRGGTIPQARMALLYRHYVVASENWAVLDSGSDKPDIDFG